MLLKTLLFLSALSATSGNEFLPAWGFECQNETCVKTLLSRDHKGMGWMLCNLVCGDEIATLWPLPSGKVKSSSETVQIDYRKINYDLPSNKQTEKLWKMVTSRFRAHIHSKIPESILVPIGGTSLLVKVTLIETTPDAEFPRLTYDTDESYKLCITQSEKQVLAEITASTFFGARHAMETLLQLIVYDDVGEAVRIMVNAEVNDAPKFMHRGVLLDTARNYFSVKAIKRTIDAMAMSKMNVLHWHVTDSHSFPFVVKSHPSLHILGAYSPRKVYTARDIANVVEFARSRGVRVIPELSGPARVGEGWQDTNMTVCFNAQPWNEFCSEPPCGHFDPTNEKLYDVLEDIYHELMEAFDADILHMGGGVSFPCWKSSAAIAEWMQSRGWSVDDSGFLQLWQHFLDSALARVDKVTQDKEIPIILWTNGMTHSAMGALNMTRFIIQSAGRLDDRTRELLNSGFRVIFTPSELTVTARTAMWNGESAGGWRRFYLHRLFLSSGSKELILGSEAMVWSQQIDEASLDSLLWPKASALAEKLWSYPNTGWREAELRLRLHRELLVENRIAAEALVPEWCAVNRNQCKRSRRLL